MDKYGNTAIHYLCMRPDLSKLNDLLSRGIDPNLPDSDGITPFDHINSWLSPLGYSDKYLYSEALLPYLNKEKLSEILIKYAIKDDTNSKEENDFNNTLLTLCKNNNSILNAKDKQGITALQHAFMRQDIHKIEILLNAGCDVNIFMMPSKNNLIIALLKTSIYPVDKKIQVINLLLDYKIDVSHVNANGESALSIIKDSTEEPIKEIFLKRGLISKPSDSITPTTPKY